MKIGIVTYTHCYNQGADLQAYALTQVLKRMGHDPEVIWFERVPMSSSQRNMVMRRALLGRIKQNPLAGIIDIFSVGAKIIRSRICSSSQKHPSVKEGEEAYDLFWRDYIPHTAKLQIADLGALRYDCYIAGSDQIWNWRLTGDISPYFLQFAPKNARKLSYAASVSIDKIDKNYESDYRDGLSYLDSISVRETYGRDLMCQYTNKPVNVVLDPTLLIKADDWRALASDKIKFDFPYILSYSLNLSVKYMKVLTDYAARHNMKVVNVTSRPTQGRSPWIIDVCNAGPREFIYLVDHAACVFTNSFHGTAFSINFQKPFFSVINPYSSTNSRIKSITDLLGLSERVVYDNAAKGIESLTPVDYQQINAKLDVLRGGSMKFLKGALNA